MVVVKGASEGMLLQLLGLHLFDRFDRSVAFVVATSFCFVAIVVGRPRVEPNPNPLIKLTNLSVSDTE